MYIFIYIAWVMGLDNLQVLRGWYEPISTALIAGD